LTEACPQPKWGAGSLWGLATEKRKEKWGKKKKCGNGHGVFRKNDTKLPAGGGFKRLYVVLPTSDRYLAESEKRHPVAMADRRTGTKGARFRSRSTGYTTERAHFPKFFCRETGLVFYCFLKSCARKPKGKNPAVEEYNSKSLGGLKYTAIPAGGECCGGG